MTNDLTDAIRDLVTARFAQGLTADQAIESLGSVMTEIREMQSSAPTDDLIAAGVAALRRSATP